MHAFLHVTTHECVHLSGCARASLLVPQVECNEKHTCARSQAGLADSRRPPCACSGSSIQLILLEGPEVVDALNLRSLRVQLVVVVRGEVGGVSTGLRCHDDFGGAAGVDIGSKAVRVGEEGGDEAVRVGQLEYKGERLQVAGYRLACTGRRS